MVNMRTTFACSVLSLHLLLLVGYATTASAPEFDSTSCVIKEIPRNGFVGYTQTPDNHLAINDIIPNFVKVKYTCAENNLVEGNDGNICVNGIWTSAAPECKPFCNPAELFSITFIANCYMLVGDTQKEQHHSCNRPAPPGTHARFNCNHGYQNIHDYQQTTVCSKDGRWTPRPIACTQRCGELIAQGTPNIIGSTVAKITDVPWHVGIYRSMNAKDNFEQICGGTILNAKMVISAMHCFWNEYTKMPHDLALFRVAAGKFYREYDDGSDAFAVQKSPIESIHYNAQEYKDKENYYAEDIVVLVLAKFIEFKPHIAPICIDYKLRREELVVQADEVGLVAGWGLEESGGLPSPVLKSIELKVVSRQQCMDSSNQQFLPFITDDKFCAGYLMGWNVCQGDSGGGLVFKRRIGTKIRYFLRGIVSVSPNKIGSCDNDHYSTFTNTAFFSDFIAYYDSLLQLTLLNSMNDTSRSTMDSNSACTITANDIPADGSVALFGSSEFLRTGDVVNHGNSVQYSCREGHYLNEVKKINNKCANGEWTQSVPICEQSGLSALSSASDDVPNQQWVGSNSTENFLSLLQATSQLFSTLAFSAAHTQSADAADMKKDLSLHLGQMCDDAFDWEITKRFLMSSPNNTILSPVLVKLMMTVLLEAAGPGTSTARELASVWKKSEFTGQREYFSKFLLSIASKSQDFDIEQGVVVYVDNSISQRPRFLAIVQSFYQTDVVQLEFSQVQKSTEYINSRSKNITTGFIEKIVTESDIDNAVILLVNAVYFDGSWKHPFSAQKTHMRAFKSEDHIETFLNFMETTAVFYYFESEELDSKILRLPYKGREAAMYLVLPNQLNGLKGMLGKIDNILMQRVKEKMNQHLVRILLPRVRFSEKIELNDVLKELGYTTIFTKMASFPLMARGPAVQDRLQISKVLQKIRLDLTEGYGATQSSPIDQTADIEFKCDHPFLFLIDDEQTGSLLFAGIVK